MNKVYLLRRLIFIFTMIISFNSSAVNTADYKCMFPIAEGKQSVKKFLLTEDVYRCLTYSNYDDFQIINGWNQVVPFRISSSLKSVDVNSYKKDIDFYREPAIAAYKTGSQIRRIAKLTGVVSGNETDAQWLEKNTYYSSVIVDQGEEKDRLRSIVLNKNAEAMPISATVVIESSNNLQDWTTVLRPHNILYLSSDGNDLQSNLLKFSSSSHARYLRIAALSNVSNFLDKIISITGEYEQIRNRAAPVQWLTIDGLKALEEPGEWSFSLPDFRPVTRVRLTSTNNIVYYQGVIQAKREDDTPGRSRDKKIHRAAKNKVKRLLKNTVDNRHSKRHVASNVWRQVSRFMHYEIENEKGSTTSPVLNIPRTQSKDWKFIFTQPEDIHLSQLPKIELGWESPQITFISQGKGPFYLLVGSDEVAERLPFPPQLSASGKNIESIDLLDLKRPDHDMSRMRNESLSTSMYEPKSILLWFFLFIGVIVMALMAVQLMKKIKSTD